MFEPWRNAQLESRFPDLTFVWKEDSLTVSPKTIGSRLPTIFRISTALLPNRHLKALLKLVDDCYVRESHQWKSAPVRPQYTVILNEPTAESTKFLTALLKMKLTAPAKILLAISGVFSVRYFGLKQSLELLLEKSNCDEAKSILPHLDLEMFSPEQALFIVPGVRGTASFGSAMPKEITHFYKSKLALQVASFLFDGRSTFGEFSEVSSEKSKNKALKGAIPREFNSRKLLVALDIVENAPRDRVNQLFAKQLLSLAGDLDLGETMNYPMDVILRRPQREYPASMRSGLMGLDLLRGFTTSSEFLQLQEDVAKFDLSSRFATFQMFGETADTFRERDTALVLSVLAEVAVTQGVMRYSEIIETLEEIIVSGIHWYLMTSVMKVELANLICEALKEENDGLPFRWVLELQGRTVLDRVPSW